MVMLHAFEKVNYAVVDAETMCTHYSHHCSGLPVRVKNEGGRQKSLPTLRRYSGQKSAGTFVHDPRKMFSSRLGDNFMR